MIYTRPTYKPQYENFIGGEWVAPTSGEYTLIIFLLLMVNY